MTTPQQIEAKAKELQIKILDDYEGRITDRQIPAVSAFLTSFAAEVRAETMETDAKLCETVPTAIASAFFADLIRSKIQL